MQLIGMNVRSALLGALYQKGLRLSSKAKQRHTVGEIVNYMSTDAQVREGCSCTLAIVYMWVSLTCL